jgi:hypothetical protein
MRSFIFRHSINVYDLRNKFIACNKMLGSGERGEGVKFIFSEWGYLFAVTTDHKVLMMREKDTQTKLDDLFKKNLYTIAISLAYSSDYDIASIMDIYRMYGKYHHS